MRASGLALVAKPRGLTSFQSLGPLKRGLGMGRIGHTGTLDRFASGLLVVLVGGYTRLGPWFTGLDKLYSATLRFGEETDTLDPEGEVVARAEPPSRADLEAVLPSFRGEILQAPPAYSAIHVEGRRASDLARRGQAPDMKPRPVVIHSLDLLDYDGRDARILVRCGSGTYIRSLARDIATALSSRARLEELERLEVGPFSLGGALRADEVSSSNLVVLDPPLAESVGLGPSFLEKGREGVFANGGELRPSWLRLAGGGTLVQDSPPGSFLAVFDAEGTFLGTIRMERGRPRYGFVLSEPEGAARSEAER